MTLTPQRPLISANWLLKNIDAPDVRVVDATWFAPFLKPVDTGHEAYQKGHIPGAVYFDIDKIADPDAALSHTLPPAHIFSARVRKLGLGDGHRIVIYDQNGFFAAARAWWMFRAMGATDVLVLDGGLSAWTGAGGALEDLPPVTTERHFTPRLRADLVKSTEQMQALVAAGPNGAQIIDARPAGRFTGDAPEPREGLASGHIPGSCNIPGNQYFAQSGYIKSPDVLAAVFKEIGVDINAPIITTCGSGVTAAITALALATLGNDLAAVYDGSWSAWAANPDNPIATGPASASTLAAGTGK